MDDLEAVLFDLDGTICVHDQDPVVLWDRAFEDAGVDPPVTPGDVAGVDAEDTPTVETEHGFFRALYEVAVEEAGGTPDPDRADAVAAAYRTAYDPAQVSYRSGAREALERARERHAVGLVTNGGRDTQTSKLASLGIQESFDAAVYCDPRAGIDPKPDPTPVELALDDLGVPADRAVLVGDTLRADVGGAHNAGVRSAWVPHRDWDRDPHPDPDHVLDGMDEFAALLE
jgi:HAD superfamily hydrolase (TIGR01509 family)